MQQTAAHRQVGLPHSRTSSLFREPLPLLTGSPVALARIRVAALNRLSGLARPADLDFAAEGFIPISRMFIN